MYQTLEGNAPGCRGKYLDDAAPICQIYRLDLQKLIATARIPRHDLQAALRPELEKTHA